MRFRYILLVAFAWAILATWLGLPWWAQITGTFATMLAAAALVDLARTLRRRAEIAEAERRPVTLNEDGTLHVPIVHPGEEVHIEGVTDADGHPRLGYVKIVRPDGTIRREQGVSRLDD